MKYLLLTVYLLFIIHYAQSCIIETKEKVKFNLTSIRDYGKIYFETVDGKGVEFSVCDNIRGRCGVEDCTTFAGCTFDASTFENEFCLGMDPIIESHYVKVGGKSAIRMIYGNGDTIKEEGCLKDQKSKFAIEIICDPERRNKPTKYELKYPECEDGYYKVVFHHADACVKNNKLSAGSILLIIIFCTFAVYIIAGIAINVGRGKSGSDLFPNKSMWIELGSLIKDGFNFVLCRNRTSYESIE